MKKFTFTIAILFCISIAFAQEQKDKMFLTFFTSHSEFPEYVNGKIKEIHYQVFHMTEENGKFVKGKPFTFPESQGVAFRQPWSYYFNEFGQLVKTSIKDDLGRTWIGVVHNANNRIENIYYLMNDTLFYNWDYEYLDNGRIELKYYIVQNNNYTGKNIFDVDSNGCLIHFIGQNKDGKTMWTEEYDRKSDGKLISYKGFRNDSLLNFYNNYKYNEKGLNLSAHVELLDGKKMNFPEGGEVEYEYDENGNWIKSISSGWMMVERRFVYY